MKCFITGAAGFIGSHLAERLLNEGHFVIGIDSLTDYYAPRLKRQNIEQLLQADRFRFVQGDLVEIDLSALLQEVDAVFHQAAQPGVRASWGKDFAIYTKNNILATQRLLEAARGANLQKFVFASSSSVYGDAECSPTPESSTPRPISPYGVSKLAAEHLCYLYWKNFGIPTVMLRYFTVYGPRQRPDMAFHRFIRSILTDGEMEVNGDGEQSRDFVFVSDIVQANLLALGVEATGETFNTGHGSPATINEVIRLLEDITGKRARIRYNPPTKGDVRHTSADISKARRALGYQPQVKLEEGLICQVGWLREALRSGLLSSPSAS